MLFAVLAISKHRCNCNCIFDCSCTCFCTCCCFICPRLMHLAEAPMQVKVLISKGTCSRCNKVELLISHLLYNHQAKVDCKNASAGEPFQGAPAVSSGQGADCRHWMQCRVQVQGAGEPIQGAPANTTPAASSGQGGDCRHWMRRRVQVNLFKVQVHLL